MEFKYHENKLSSKRQKGLVTDENDDFFRHWRKESSVIVRHEIFPKKGRQ